MILKGPILEDQLEFDSCIERRIVKRNRSKKRREQQIQTGEETSNNFTEDIQPIQEDISMADERNPPSRRTFGDYVMQQGLRRFSNIAVSTTTKTLKMKPTFLNLISGH